MMSYMNSYYSVVLGAVCCSYFLGSKETLSLYLDILIVDCIF
jgi:hypothetical protein